jgi:hypothetical protein
MKLKRNMPMVPVMGTSVIERLPRLTQADKNDFVKSLAPSSVSFFNDLDASYQAKRILRHIKAGHGVTANALGDYCQRTLNTNDLKGSALRFLLQDAFRAPQNASLASLFEAALFSDVARRELQFRLRQTEPSRAVFTAPKKRRPEDAPKPSLRRYRTLASAIEAADFMDAAMKRAALMTGFAFLVAWCPPMTILPPSPHGLAASAWPLVPDDWKPASEEDFEALAGHRFGDTPSVHDLTPISPLGPNSAMI